MKKRTLQWGVAFFLCAMAGLLIWAFWLRRPKTYMERFPNQVGVSKEDCENLLNDYEVSFDTLVSSLTSHIVGINMDYSIDVDKRGHMDIPKELCRDVDLVTAIKEIHSDNLFKTNPLTIHAGRGENGLVWIRILLVSEEKCSVTMVYRESGTGSEKERINDHWFWTVFFAI